MSLDRDVLVDRLRFDLIGPTSADERLPDRPSDVYLTGILWPRETRMGGEDDDRLGAGDANGEEGTEGGEEEEVSLVGTMRPCVAGLSFAVASDTARPTIEIEVEFGLYGPLEDETGERWQRRAFKTTLPPVDASGAVAPVRLSEFGAPDGVEIRVRSVPWSIDTRRLITVTLVNSATPAEQTRRETEQVTLFQTSIRVLALPGTQIVPRPGRRPVIDADDRSTDLLYRDAYEFAVGHTCGATWTQSEGGGMSVRTDWIPVAEVRPVSPDGHPVFEVLRTPDEPVLNAQWLADADDRTLDRALAKLPQAYNAWLALEQDRVRSLPERFQPTAREHLEACRRVSRRIEEAAKRIATDPRLASAFRLANRAMVIQSEWSQRRTGPPQDKVRRLEWRPFQLGFLLLTALSTIDREHADRSTMDLLWFPTGGGKTEAYLALIAFTAFARRLRNPAAGGGVTALMRYTLRLLTTQQFTRAAAMVLACEALRRRRILARDLERNLGEEPFGIGLWVGGEATPNDVETAAAVLAGRDGPSPRQLVSCPACGKELDWKAKTLRGRPTTVEVRCIESECVLHDRERPLPVYTTDQDIYQRRPTLLIGTVDKFAQVVRRPEVGGLFRPAGSAPPDLVIQDELHLISGPLGTLAGLYEAGIDLLLSDGDSPPKVIGSTATIRKAADQVLGLFCREVCQFPPAAIDALESGFATPANASVSGRLYVGVTTAGRSAKFTLQAVAGSLLQSGAAGFASDKERNPYWTLVGYFNALRELGGAMVLMQDDVPDSIGLYSRRRREPQRQIFAVEELTSRRSQDEVREMLDLMDIPAGRDGALDAVLATNMLSVGVDIQRLGLMLVNGQPKGISEYIQATSRVGRRHPGLVVVVLNNAKARDRSHFESFRTWHATLYRDVEATSVTPFASRARDRALHAALLAAARHLVPGLSDRPGLDATRLIAVEALIKAIAKRAATIDSSETAVEAELRRFVDRWQSRGARSWWNDYDPARSLLISAETAAALQAQGRDARGAVPTPNSMRNVEPSVPFRLAPLLTQRSGGGAP